jgi:hypothetical protein
MRPPWKRTKLPEGNPRCRSKKERQRFTIQVERELNLARSTF